MTKLFIYQFLHVGSVLLLTGFTFFALASGRPELRRMLLIITGILSLVTFVSAFGLISVVYGNHFTVWMILKIVLWLGLTAMTGLAYRLPAKRPQLLGITVIMVLASVYLVYAKPFMN